MPELPIDALLTGLDDTIEPDAAFDARLRRLLAAELEPPAPAAGPESQTPLEVLELEATGTTENPASRWRLAAAAAAVIGVVLVAVVLLRDGDGGTAPIVDDPAVSVIGTERTFAGAELDSTTIAEGGNPYWVAAGADLLVVSLEGDLTRLDPTNLVPTGTLQLSESSPVAVGAGAVWVADALSGTVKRIDPAAMQVSATIPTGIAIDPGTRRPLGVAQASGPARSMARIGGIDATGDAVWVGDHDGRLLLVDPDEDAVVREIGIDLRPDLVRVSDGMVLVGDLGRGAVVVLDEATGEELVRFDSVDRLVGADLHAGGAYVLDGADGTATRVDVATGATTASDPFGASWNAAGQPIYDAGLVVGDAGVVLETDEGFFVLDPITLALDGVFELEGTGGEMAIGPEGAAYVVRYSGRTVTRVTPVAP